MSVNTALVEGQEISFADKWILEALQLVPAQADMVRNAPKRIGLRNEKGEIYRVIGVAEMSQLLEVFVQLSGLFLNVEVHGKVRASKPEFDAVFSVVAFVKWQPCPVKNAIATGRSTH